ncbi:HAD family hydrolase [Eubacterium pyruvativorans]|uniref:HAD family hydrolase n=1 Tax=Eubacterium pyruvativorans TaxID=155865 RepID=UPI0013D1EBF2|nr:HAD hydrolase family protein [Eubacterium pyruvativorans]MDD7684337.1 HAD family hydrolase [Eubacterium pyruvativorans]
MIKIEIPGRDTLNIEQLVLDYNGTIAEDGNLINGVEERLARIRDSVEIYILTADTYGTVRSQCEHMGIHVETFPRAGAAECKLEIVKSLGENTMCIGNGFNDVLMFDQADLSVAVIEKEGLYAGLLNHADVVTTSILDALDLLLHTDRLRATLRS